MIKSCIMLELRAAVINCHYFITLLCGTRFKYAGVFKRSGHERDSG